MGEDAVTEKLILLMIGAVIGALIAAWIADVTHGTEA